MDLTEKLVRTRVVYQGKYIRAEEQTVLLPNGNEAMREIVSPPNAVGILPIDASGKVYLVRQYRPAIGRVTLEIPAGIFPGHATTPPDRPSAEWSLQVQIQRRNQQRALPRIANA